MQGIIDRIENNIVVIEYNEKIYNVDINLVDGTIIEGDVVDVIFNEDKIISVRKNEDKTKSRKEYIKELTKDMWQ